MMNCDSYDPHSRRRDTYNISMPALGITGPKERSAEYTVSDVSLPLRS